MAENLSTSTFEIKHPLQRNEDWFRRYVTPTSSNIERIHISMPSAETVLLEPLFQMSSSEFLDHDIKSVIYSNAVKPA